MSEDEKRKKAYNNLLYIIVTDIYDNEVRIDKTKIVNEYNESVGIILDYIDKLQKELDKKDKVIDLMAQALEDLKIAHLKKDNGFYRLKNKDELKEDFFKEAEE